MVPPSCPLVESGRTIASGARHNKSPGHRDLGQLRLPVKGASPALERASLAEMAAAVW